MPKSRLKRFRDLDSAILNVLKTGKHTTKSVQDRVGEDTDGGVTWNTVRSYLEDLEKKGKVVGEKITPESNIVIWSMA